MTCVRWPRRTCEQEASSWMPACKGATWKCHEWTVWAFCSSTIEVNLDGTQHMHRLHQHTTKARITSKGLNLQTVAQHDFSPASPAWWTQTKIMESFNSMQCLYSVILLRGVLNDSHADETPSSTFLVCMRIWREIVFIQDHMFDRRNTGITAKWNPLRESHSRTFNKFGRFPNSILCYGRPPSKTSGREKRIVTRVERLKGEFIFDPDDHLYDQKPRYRD